MNATEMDRAIGAAADFHDILAAIAQAPNLAPDLAALALASVRRGRNRRARASLNTLAAAIGVAAAPAANSLPALVNFAASNRPPGLAAARSMSLGN